VRARAELLETPPPPPHREPPPQLKKNSAAGIAKQRLQSTLRGMRKQQDEPDKGNMLSGNEVYDQDFEEALAEAAKMAQAEELAQIVARQVLSLLALLVQKIQILRQKPVPRQLRRLSKRVPQQKGLQRLQMRGARRKSEGECRCLLTS
jgi:hypothetical protein